MKLALILLPIRRVEELQEIDEAVSINRLLEFRMKNPLYGEISHVDGQFVYCYKGDAEKVFIGCGVC